MLHELVASISLSVWQIADSGFRQCSDRFSGRGWQKANTNLQVKDISMHAEVGTSAVQYSRLSEKEKAVVCFICTAYSISGHVGEGEGRAVKPRQKKICSGASKHEGIGDWQN